MTRSRDVLARTSINLALNAHTVRSWNAHNKFTRRSITLKMYVYVFVDICFCEYVLVMKSRNLWVR
jgi:hypothetical protein